MIFEIEVTQNSITYYPTDIRFNWCIEQIDNVFYVNQFFEKPKLEKVTIGKFDNLKDTLKFCLVLDFKVSFNAADCLAQ